VITGEYSTGMIRSSFAAVPKRLPVLWAKPAVFGLVALALALPSTLIAFFGAQALLKGHTVTCVPPSRGGTLLEADRSLTVAPG
jgi:ABC-2 type transport system permease protein